MTIFFNTFQMNQRKKSEKKNCLNIFLRDNFSFFLESVETYPLKHLLPFPVHPSVFFLLYLPKLPCHFYLVVIEQQQQFGQRLILFLKARILGRPQSTALLMVP